MELIFDRDFLADLAWWIKTDRKAALRVLTLVDAIARDPTSGLGKPERLRHLVGNVWSRRVTQEHRLVYRIDGGRVFFLQARYHY